MNVAHQSSLAKLTLSCGSHTVHEVDGDVGGTAFEMLLYQVSRIDKS